MESVNWRRVVARTVLLVPLVLLVLYVVLGIVALAASFIIYLPICDGITGPPISTWFLRSAPKELEDLTNCGWHQFFRGVFIGLILSGLSFLSIRWVIKHSGWFGAPSTEQG